MGPELGERQAAILRALVREYIRSGEPVGSQHLVERARINVSSATVRNEMARLEELGFLAQPHTSAGRIPTELAFRFLVDELKPRPLAEGRRRQLAEELHSDEPESLDDLIHRASDVAARFTRYAAAVLARGGRPSRLRRLELFSMGARMATLILIAENGRVEQSIIPLDPDVTVDDVERMGARLMAELQGVTLENAAQKIDVLQKQEGSKESSLLGAVRAGIGALRDATKQVAVGGASNLASEHDFERETLHRVYETLEREQVVMDLLATAFDAPLTVRIGSELPAEELRSCSLVVANFGAADGSEGSVGVIGPVRMDYERVIATAQTVARLLEGTLGSAAPNP